MLHKNWWFNTLTISLLSLALVPNISWADNSESKSLYDGEDLSLIEFLQKHCTDYSNEQAEDDDTEPKSDKEDEEPKSFLHPVSNEQTTDQAKKISPLSYECITKIMAMAKEDISILSEYFNHLLGTTKPPADETNEADPAE